MATKKKARVKLLTVKEARAKVLLQANDLEIRRLQINALENQVESLEGARRNLRMMLDSHESELNKAKSKTIEALASVKSIERTLDRTIVAAEAWMHQVRAYEAETPRHMFVRSIKKFFSPVTKAVSSFFERLKYRFKRIG